MHFVRQIHQSSLLVNINNCTTCRRLPKFTFFHHRLLFSPVAVFTGVFCCFHQCFFVVFTSSFCCFTSGFIQWLFSPVFFVVFTSGSCCFNQCFSPVVVFVFTSGGCCFNQWFSPVVVVVFTSGCCCFHQWLLFSRWCCLLATCASADPRSTRSRSV